MKSKEKIELSAGADLFNFLHDLLNKRQDLLSQAKEFDDIDNTLKEYFTGVPKFAIGKYSVEGNWAEEDIFDVPQEVKKKYQKKIKRWVVDIKEI
ncbi:hypothetical protein Dip510_002033 [Elusimicrobium posterum]|uniref:hypothetical protein n=1 Tax=Elusimicrobium posterum TaxID=3116653 RepID=UPI003C75E4F8